MIEFKHVFKTYSDGTEALNDLSLKINDGEFVTLIGPSGCGKTTAMKMVNRLIEPSSGSIYIRNRNVKEYNVNELRWNIGYVLQEIALFPHLTIEENIAVVPEMKRWKRKTTRARVKELLDMAGLDPDTYQKRMPSELSGGQQQRIGVVRALAADPDIILMDEPFSALDPISREQLQEYIRDLQRKINKTILFVTHDMDEAMALGDKVCLMRDGKVIQADTPQQLILHPATPFVRDFIGERKSPWQTAVDVIASESYKNIITKSEFDQKQFPKHGIYFICSKDQTYEGAVCNGVLSSMITLPNNTPLYKASDIIEASEQTIFPVLKNEKLQGVLTYKDIVRFLRKKTKMENGVIHS